MKNHANEIMKHHEHKGTKEREKMKNLSRTTEEIRYAQLWAEIELPKLLRGEEP